MHGWQRTLNSQLPFRQARHVPVSVCSIYSLEEAYRAEGSSWLCLRVFECLEKSLKRQSDLHTDLAVSFSRSGSPMTGIM